MRLPTVETCCACPHHGRCCSHGTQLLGDEVKRITDAHGWGVVYFSGPEGCWRTQVADGRCIFQAATGACSIHHNDYYPSTCRFFPWADENGDEPYQYDLTICPSVQP